jgi:hypothetical protein
VFNFVRPSAVKSTESFFRRVAESARYTIRGVKPDTWMSPLQPLAPFLPITTPRQFDYQVGRNIFYQPRGNERYDFDQLRMVARHSELTRLAIETRMDQMAAIKWQIKSRDEDNDNSDPRIKQITEFFASPDKVRDWDQWLRCILEELFVTDAVSIARRYNRGGGLYALEQIDGSTIFPLIDADGRTPAPPDPAYQQILKGVPKADYTTQELIYYVRKTQINTPYGWSPVEQIIESAQTDIERIKYTLSYFTEGSVPDSYITAPDGMTPDRVLAYQDMLNSLLAGNRAGRRQMPVLVHGMEIHNLKQAELKNDFDEWLARKICFAFSLPPTAFVKQLNRNTSESAQDAAKEEGLFPVLLYVKRLVDKVIREDFNAPELEFHWEDDKDIDPKIQAEIDCMFVDKGIKSRNEVRDEYGLAPVIGGEEPLVTGTITPLPGSALDLQMKEEQAIADEQAARIAHENNLALTSAKVGAEVEPKKPGEEEITDPVEKRRKKKLYDGLTSSFHQHVHPK